MSAGSYTTRRVTIQALQFTDANREALQDWLTAELEPEMFRITPGHVEISTLEGDRDCPLGYWIIKGTRSEFYPVHPDVFADKYEPATRRVCAHADIDGEGMHLLEPGETCPRLQSGGAS